MAKKAESLQSVIDAIEPRPPEDRYVFTVELPQPWKERLRKVWKLSREGFSDDEVEAFVEMLLTIGIETYERELDAQEKIDNEERERLMADKEKDVIEGDDVPF